MKLSGKSSDFGQIRPLIADSELAAIELIKLPIDL